MSSVTTLDQVNQVVNKYNKLEISESSSKNTTNPTIQVELKNANGFVEGYQDLSKYLPETTKKRFDKYGIDYSRGYPTRPEKLLLYLDDAYKIRDKVNPNYVERGKNADPEKKALFSAAKEIRQLTKYVGTEIVGLQLQDLNEKQLDELALLISERIVVVFRNQDLSPQKHLEIGKYYGEVEVHPLAAQLIPGVSVIWKPLQGNFANFRKGTSGSPWHTDLDHEFLPPGITHLHIDSIPENGGDTAFVSGYAAYDKLSPEFQKFLDGKVAVHKSAHVYYDRENVLGGPRHIEREHPLIVTNPVTGWKSLFYNPSHVVRIKDLEPEESDLITGYLRDIFERNLDIQARIKWQPTEKGLGTSVIWDNRISQHVAIRDLTEEESLFRHGSRVTSLTTPHIFDPNSKSQREALGLA